MSNIKVTITDIKQKSILITLPEEFSYNDFLGELKKNQINPTEYSFAIGNSPINLKNEKEFNKKKDLINDGSSILMMQRFSGGTDNKLTDLHVDVIDKIKKGIKNIKKEINECVVCMDDIECLKLCCSNICVECFNNFLKRYFLNDDIKCYLCKKNIDSSYFYKFDKNIENQLKTLTTISSLIKNIDISFCKCGDFGHNSTMYSKQQCKKCKYVFCFFCNRVWDDLTMKNNQFFCKDDCTYKTYLSFTEVEFNYNKKLKIPDRRVCPNCSRVGAYDKKCKFHVCICGFEFCFWCLKERSKCTKSYNQMCVDKPVIQSFKIFKRFEEE